MKGVNELNKHLRGERLTIRQMVYAKCADCMGNYADGRIDCLIPDCSLYPLMPYGAMRGQYKSRQSPSRPFPKRKEGKI